MTVEKKERRIWLIRQLQKEMPEYAGYQIPEDKQEQRHLLKGLFNVRPVQPASDEFTRIQNEYLQERAKEKGITNSAELLPATSDKRLILWQGDITTLNCDAIVNASNNSLTGCWNPDHFCVDNLIQTFSGYQTRRDGTDYIEKMRKIHGQDYVQPTAVPIITSAYNLPSKYIIHVVGPIVSPYLMQEHKNQLAACYRNCLDLAAEHDCENIAFCCISTGVFMFPQDKAAEIAVKTVKEWLDVHTDSCLKKVIFNVFKDSDLRVYQKLLGVSDSRGFKKIMGR